MENREKLLIDYFNLKSENEALKNIIESLKSIIEEDGKTIEYLRKKISNNL